MWFTPHTLVLTNEELKALGGPYHKYLGPLGIMPAKNTAVNIMILFTAVSFLIYRRANRVATVSWVSAGNAIQVALFTAGILPYYLHQLDPVAGAAHFAVSDEQARACVAEATARLPGYLVPRLVREIAGAASKLPV